MGVRWLVGAILAAVVGIVVTAALTGKSDSGGDTSTTAKGPRPAPRVVARARPADPFEGGLRTGYGPSRPAFACTRANICDGPHYVAFNSYYNTPNYGDERPFVKVKDADAGASRTFRNQFSARDADRPGRSRDVVMQVYIHNNTYEKLPDLKVTDALDTRIRLVLPAGPVYTATPTVYLRADNARPRVVWGTAWFNSERPMHLTYVAGSARLADHAGAMAVPENDRDITSKGGWKLGRWKADFPNSALLTFRVHVAFLPEPVRDPLATWQGYLTTKTSIEAPATSGPLAEPKVDGATGAQFTCSRTACSGAPYPALNVYRNHPLLGNESDFLLGEMGADYGATGQNRYRSVLHVRPGDEVIVRLAIDNGGDPAAIGAPSVRRLTARRVRVRMLIPSGTSNAMAVVAWVNAANTYPRWISDTLPLRSEQPIRLRLVPRSARIVTSQGARQAPTRELFLRTDSPSTVVSGGALVGDIEPSFSKVSYVGLTLSVDGA
jgi:hypothetical protein